MIHVVKNTFQRVFMLWDFIEVSDKFDKNLQNCNSCCTVHNKVYLFVLHSAQYTAYLFVRHSARYSVHIIVYTIHKFVGAKWHLVEYYC